jgi:hypothetical protein
MPDQVSNPARRVGEPFIFSVIPAKAGNFYVRTVSDRISDRPQLFDGMEIQKLNQ